MYYMPSKFVVDIIPGVMIATLRMYVKFYAKKKIPEYE